MDVNPPARAALMHGYSAVENHLSQEQQAIAVDKAEGSIVGSEGLTRA